MRSKLTNSWAVVTGASDGIGRALSLELGRRGYKVFAVGRNAIKLASLQSEFPSTGQLEILSIDLNKASANEELLQRLGEREVELFIPAAGFGSSGNFVDQLLENELSMIDVNCRAVVEQTQFFAQRFQNQGNGTVVLFSSLLGTAGAGTSAVYAATKNFIHAFSEGLRVELRSSGVKVLTVCPGPTNSGFAEASHMTYSGADSSADVAAGIIRNLGKNKTIYPAKRAQFLGFTLSTVPRSFRVSILTNFMHGIQAK